MKGRGFVLTMDSMVALVMATVFIVAILHFASTPTIQADDYMFSFAGDVLAVADKDGSILHALSGDSTSIGELMDSASENMCLNLTVTDSLDKRVYTRSTGCGEPARYVTAKRTIVNNTSDYTAELRVWLR